MQILTGRKPWLPLLAVILFAVAAVAIGFFLPSALASSHGTNHEFVIEAHKFGYSPPRIHVNLGDTVTLRLQARDVMHGLYLDGYGLETHASPAVPGISGGEGVLTFVADKPGKFRFRCSTTCGNLHPFMIGELQVQSGTSPLNAPFLGAAAAAVFVAGGALAFVWKAEGGR